MLTDRQLLILEAIICHYTDDSLPVGSKVLQQQLPLHVSSATIRNEMAYLEKMGLITKEHLSSGRIPSFKGYRYYVDNLVKPKRIGEQELGSIKEYFSSDFLRVDEIVEASAKILSKLTNYVAITLKPKSKMVKLEGFRIVPIGNEQVMFILVASDGTVESQIFTLPKRLQALELDTMIKVVNDNLAGLPISEVPQKIKEVIPILSKYVRELDDFLDVFNSIIKKTIREQIFVKGKHNLLNLVDDDEGLDKLRNFYSLVEESSKIDSLLDFKHDLSVKFGSESKSGVKTNYTLISAIYNDGYDGNGLIAILGPTNMQYSRMLGLVGALRDELNAKILDYYHNFDN